MNLKIIFIFPKNVELYCSFRWGESKKSSQAKASATSGQKTQAGEVCLLPPEQHLQSYVGGVTEAESSCWLIKCSHINPRQVLMWLSCFIVINATFQQILTELTRVKDTEKGMGWGCVQKYIYLCPVLHWQNDILLLQIVYKYKISINIRIWHGEDDVIKVHMWVPKWFLYFIWYYLISHDGWEFYCTYSHFVFICMLVWVFS